MRYSIITVCYNSQKTLERTIKSVLAQSNKDYEYIIVDGASTDNTLSILSHYEPLFEGRMNIRSERDNGIYDAMNKGIARAVGDYVWIVNSDDFIQPDALNIIDQKIMGIDKDKYPIISGSLNSFSEKEQKVAYRVSKDAAKGKRCFMLDLTGFNHPATLIPKYVYNKLGNYDSRFKINADCDFFHRTFSAGIPYLYIPEVLTNMSDGGISGQWNLKRLKITLADGKLYFNKNYTHLFKRYCKHILWTMLMIRLYFKKKFYT